MARSGVTMNTRRKEEPRNVDLTTPYGTDITVTAARAETLLNRPAVRFADQSLRKYVEAGEDPTIERAQRATAQPNATNDEFAELRAQIEELRAQLMNPLAQLDEDEDEVPTPKPATETPKGGKA